MKYGNNFELIRNIFAFFLDDHITSFLLSYKCYIPGFIDATEPNQEQKSAIQELVKDRIIENFPKEKMARLIAKGESTHIEDKKELEELMKNFLPAIMPIGNNKIEEVEKKVNEKVPKIEPSPKLDSSSAERVSGEVQGVS